MPLDRARCWKINYIGNFGSDDPFARPGRAKELESRARSEEHYVAQRPTGE
jgi:hypothetical protein